MILHSPGDLVSVARQRVARLVESLKIGSAEDVQAVFNCLHPADAATVIHALSPDERTQLLEMLGKSFNAEILLFLDEQIRGYIFNQWAHAHLVAALGALDRDDLHEILNDLSDSERYSLLPVISPEMRKFLTHSLSYPANTAGRIMRLQVICLPENWTIHKACQFISKANNLPDEVCTIYILGTNRRLVGKIDLLKLFRLDPSKTLKECCENLLYVVLAHTKVSDVLLMFRKYSLYSVPVIDYHSRVIGEILVDKVLDIVHEEAEDALIHFHAGTDEFDFFYNIVDTTKLRLGPILMSMFMNCITVYILTLYQDTLSQAVDLVSLLPLIPAVGATGGMQCVTMTVRALSSGDLDTMNYWRALRKELHVSVYLGVIQGFLLALSLFYFKSKWSLSVLVGLSTLCIVVCSSLFGVVIPLALTFLGQDPALLSSSLLSNLTDWLGYFIFLTLAIVCFSY